MLRLASATPRHTREPRTQKLKLTYYSKADSDNGKAILPSPIDDLSLYQNPCQVERAQTMVLRNHELLELVMSFMAIPSSDGEEYIIKPHITHLLWASLTCKNFFDPAMNILWKSVTSWKPILPLIATSMIVQDPQGENSFKHLVSIQPSPSLLSMINICPDS